MEVFTAVLSIVVISLHVLYYYVTSLHNYWKKKGVAGPKPFPFVGNFGEFFLRRISFGGLISKIYSQYPGKQIVGIYQGRTPMLLLRDPEVIKDVLIKDFSNFHNRGLAISKEPLGDNLFNAEDETWHVLRQRLSPMFTSAKLKNMFPLIIKSSQDFQLYVEELIKTEEQPEIRQIMAKYTLEVIGSCAFGINMNNFNNKDNIYRNIGAKIFAPRLKATILRALDSIIPGIVAKLNLSVSNREVTDFFLDLVGKIVKEREGKPKIRNDFMDLMLDIKEEGRISGSKSQKFENMELDITDNIIAAQAVIFYAAGFETSSQTMSFLLHELALHEEIQDRLYQEIKTATKKYDDCITYDALHEMEYLEMVLSETLRKYSIGGALIRKCVSEHVLSITNLRIEKGIKVVVPVTALHHDPKYFPNPEVFDPERFSVKNKGNIKSCTYLPFGDGPRNCVGLRFAKVQSMVGIAAFLQKFKVSPSEKTKSQLSFDPTSVTLQSLDGIWMKIERRPS